MCEDENKKTEEDEERITPDEFRSLVRLALDLYDEIEEYEDILRESLPEEEKPN